MPTDNTLARQALALVQRTGEPQVLGELDGDTYVEIPALVARLGSDGNTVDIVGLRAGWEGTPVARLIGVGHILASRDAEIAARDVLIANLQVQLAAASTAAEALAPAPETPVSVNTIGCPFCDDNTRRPGQSISRHIYLAHRGSYDAWKATGSPTRPTLVTVADWAAPDWEAGLQMGKEDAMGDAGIIPGVAP